MPSAFLIWGAGGHGKVVADLVRACGHDVSGFIDGDAAKVGRKVGATGSVKVFSEQDFLENVGSSRRLPADAGGVALALGQNESRQRALKLLAGCCVPSLVHPSATLSPSATVGRGAVVLPGAVVNAEARIGRVAIVNSGAVIEHECLIDDAVHVSPGAVLAGGVRVGERSWIGAGATVIQGVRIGPDAMIGAGAVVIRDVPSGAVVVGVPARPIREV